LQKLVRDLCSLVHKFRKKFAQCRNDGRRNIVCAKFALCNVALLAIASRRGSWAIAMAASMLLDLAADQSLS
jgi:ribosomal protein S14